MLSERGERQHEALQRDASELVVSDRRYLGLRHAEQLRRVELGKTPALYDVVDLLRQDRLSRELFGIRQAKIGENVVRAAILHPAGHVQPLPRLGGRCAPSWTRS